jgi:CheY-like chemotaxis protein
VIQTRIELAENLPLFVGNESEIRESITNLILNAVDAMPQGGTLWVRTLSRDWTPDPLQKMGQSYVILDVSDSGVGMDSETKARCLDPFFSTKGQRGTGLGLAMVYGVMERHEGKIEVQSEVGKGTTMSLIFPIRAHVSISGLNRGVSTRDVTGLHILCIDDEPLLREMLKELLTFRKHDVVTADGGESGINAFLSARKTDNPFDVVITDLGMPYVDGKQVALKIKSESPKTPVVMLTGWGTMMKDDGDIPVDVDMVLSKPPRILELQGTLNNLFADRIPNEEKG